MQVAEASSRGNERKLKDDEIIVSKTDLKGRITYCNDVFKRIAGFKEVELMGKPHSIIRHPDMPRCVFKLLWETLETGSEIFAYVKNRAKNDDFYWVFAHVTPDYGSDGRAIGFNSFRRSVEPKALAVIEPLYADLLLEESHHGNRKTGMNAAYERLLGLLAAKGVTYDEFVLSL